MRDAILLIAVLITAALGYILISGIDNFLYKNHKTIRKNEEVFISAEGGEVPSCVMLTQELSDEEVINEVRRFRDSHGKTRIMLYGEESKEI